MFWTLVRKDIRLLRPVTWTAIGLAVLFYAALPLFSYVNWRMSMERASGGQPYRLPYYESIRSFASPVVDGTKYGWLICIMLGTVIGGMAFAMERRERWGDFVAMLPVERRKTISIKAIVVIAACLGMAAVNGFVLVLTLGFCPGAGYWYPSVTVALNFILPLVSCGVLLVGVAWLLSAILSSPVLATSITLGGAGGVFLWWLQMLGMAIRDTVQPPYVFMLPLEVTSLVIGLAAMVVGATVQLYRRSP